MIFPIKIFNLAKGMYAEYLKDFNNSVFNPMIESYVPNDAIANFSTINTYAFFELVQSSIVNEDYFDTNKLLLNFIIVFEYNKSKKITNSAKDAIMVGFSFHKNVDVFIKLFEREKIDKEDYMDIIFGLQSFLGKMSKDIKKYVDSVGEEKSKWIQAILDSGLMTFEEFIKSRFMNSSILSNEDLFLSGEEAFATFVIRDEDEDDDNNDDDFLTPVDNVLDNILDSLEDEDNEDSEDDEDDLPPNIKRFIDSIL